MKIYTRNGDNGTTGLIGSDRVSKADLRVDCIGTVDELNAFLGHAEVVAPEPIRTRLRQVQHELFNIGSHLATPDEEHYGSILPVLGNELLERLEQEIDQAESESGRLQHFILPGGSEPAARLHLARAVCRRAERRCVQLAGTQNLHPNVCKYLNRLADWLFMHARHANHLVGTPDTQWKK